MSEGRVCELFILFTSFDFIWLTPNEVESLRHEIVEVYLATFSQPPYNKDEV